MSRKLPAKSSSAEIATFVHNIRSRTPDSATHRGRLLFAMDATASRAPTWDSACRIQAEMFTQSAVPGSLDVQLAFFRGYAEFQASNWHSQPQSLLHDMLAVGCLGGITQIEKVLEHALKENKKHKINAIVFVGDSVEENIERLSDLSGRLGLLGVPLFIFHEGLDSAAASAFQQMAKLSGGAYCRFDQHSAEQLRDLLTAVAAYAVGGKTALAQLGAKRGGLTQLLLQQLIK